MQLSMDDTFCWTTEILDRYGCFAGERKSKGHLVDPDDRSMTLCGREIPRYATTDSGYNVDHCKRCEFAAKRFNAEEDKRAERAKRAASLASH